MAKTLVLRVEMVADVPRLLVASIGMMVQISLADSEVAIVRVYIVHLHKRSMNLFFPGGAWGLLLTEFLHFKSAHFYFWLLAVVMLLFKQLMRGLMNGFGDLMRRLQLLGI